MTTLPPAVPRPSATVMIVRDAPVGIEVFMVARDRQVDFASGAIVFPGGKLDEADSDIRWTKSAPTARTPALPYWIAAVRETFEESGILLARSRDSGGIVDGPAASRIGERHRSALLDGARSFIDIMQEEALAPALDHMVPFAHWITPVEAPRRFETHFFLVAAPTGHAAQHDGREAVRSLWATPSALIADADSGGQVLVPATRLNLELLAESATVADAMSATRARRIVTVTPAMAKAEGGVRISIPPEAGYRTTDLFIPRPAQR
ncbi:MAG: NUDIX hydrolase [Hyphomicrobiales bacterium]|nr:NUDIX hydrolase [Hyphomicrobiales bacterium]